MSAAQQLALTDAGDEIERWATLSDDGVYRYSLGRRWADGPVLPWVMLNPSTAGASVDDPTVRRCMGFARGWGYAGIVVRNVYALRATDPRELDRHDNPVGADNDHHLTALGYSDRIVCAWGARVPPWLAQRTAGLLTRNGATLGCLGCTKAGAPRHPLYVRGDQPFEEWSP